MSVSLTGQSYLRANNSLLKLWHIVAKSFVSKLSLKLRYMAQISYSDRTESNRIASF